MAMFTRQQLLFGFCLTFAVALTGLMVAGMPRSMSAQVPLQEMAAKLPGDTYASFLQEELPRISGQQEQRGSWAGTFLAQLTQMRLDDPKAWLESELPGFRGQESSSEEPLREQVDVVRALTSTEAPPPEAVVAAWKNEQEEPPASERAKEALTTGGKKVVFIYHTHNREAYIRDLKDKSKARAYDAKTNITLVGKRLAAELDKRGIGAEVSTKDYWSELKGKYHLSYAASRKTVQAAIAQNRDIQYILDIHRDALPREKTTRKINGVDYAAIVFVVGQANKNWKQNEQFAKQLHEELNKKYPGLSKGVTGKNTEGGRSNGEYNQSVHPNSILVEIGGHENTLEEAYRSAAALADALAAVYWQAEAVSAPAAPKGN